LSYEANYFYFLHSHQIRLSGTLQIQLRVQS
jgi:hypothetical protein